MNIEKSTCLFAKASAYRFTGLFLDLPNELVSQGVMDGSAASDLQDILCECGVEDEKIRSIIDGFSTIDTSIDMLTQLRRDYTRLFTNPQKVLVPIYEAVFKGSDDFDTSQLVFISPTAIDAEHSYKRFNLIIDPKKHDSPDHMAAEIEFLCFLYQKLSETTSSDNSGAAQEYVHALDEFYDKHISKWAKGFFSTVELLASTHQYRAIGTLGCALMDLEAERRLDS